MITATSMAGQAAQLTEALEKVDPARRSETRTEPSALAYPIMKPSPLDAPHALVVDDDLIIRMDAMDILEMAGFYVMGADHAHAALALLETRHPDVVLLFTDVQMPGQLDGFALAHKVAASWPHISIVVASGQVTPGPGSMPAKARFIAKPFSAELVHAHLHEILPEGQKPAPLVRAGSAARGQD